MVSVWNPVMEKLCIAALFCCLPALCTALRASKEYSQDYTKSFFFTVQRNDSCVPISLPELEASLNGTNLTVQQVQCAGMDRNKLEDNLKRFQALDNCANSSYSFCSCCHAMSHGYPFSGVYNVRNARVYCEFFKKARKAGMVILRRNTSDNSVNFNQPFTHYERYEGFGSVDSNHWVGLEFLHQFTECYNPILHIELTNDTGNKTKHVVTYSNFRISSKRLGYRINVGGYNGTLPDYLSLHNNDPFSTPDNDHSDYNCAIMFQTGWWYNECWYVLFTGTLNDYNLVYWGNYVFTAVTMMLLPTNACQQEEALDECN